MTRSGPFVADPAEAELLRAQGWEPLSCGTCNAIVWRSPTGALLNGVAAFQIASEERPVDGKMLECFGCNEIRWDKMTSR